MLGILVLFWITSGLIPLLVSFDTATAILTSRGIGRGAAQIFVALGSIADVLIGCAIAIRSICRLGLIAGTALTGVYLAVGTMVAPDLWRDPLGAMTKVLPILVLMIICLSVLDNR